MSAVGQHKPDEDVVLVFRPPENPAAQIAGITPFKSLRLRLDELLDWFKDLNVDSIDLWIEGAYKAGNRTELFLSVEGKTGAKLTLRPFSKHQQLVVPPQYTQAPPPPASPETPAKENENSSDTKEKPVSETTVQTVAFFSPDGGVERQVVSLIDNAVISVEMAAFQFTNQYIEKALLEGVKRGVKVSIVLDRSETRAEQAAVHDELEKAGTEIRLLGPSKGLMHSKYLVIDGKTVQWGSYNYNEQSELRNLENATFATDTKLARQYHDDFEAMFNQAKPESGAKTRQIRRFFRHLTSRSNAE